MKKKIAIITLVGLGLFLGISNVFAFTITQYPSDTEITSPVTFDLEVSREEMEDFCVTTTDPVMLSWVFSFDDGSGWTGGHWIEGGVTADEVATGVYSRTYIFPTGWDIRVEGVELEYDDSWGVCWDYWPANPTFTITGQRGLNFVEIPNLFVGSTLAYIGSAVTGLSPILYVIIGVPFAFVVIRKVIALMPKK